MIWHTKEGQSLRQGINWDTSRDTKLKLLLKLWRFRWYFRIRPQRIVDESKCRRFLFNFSYVAFKSNGYEQIFGELYYNWNSRTFKVGSCVVTEDLLADFVETVGTRQGTAIDYYLKKVR